MGWLMGLEPTTTGITILIFLYSAMLIKVVQSIQINSLQDTHWIGEQLAR